MHTYSQFIPYFPEIEPHSPSSLWILSDAHLREFKSALALKSYYILIINQIHGAVRLSWAVGNIPHMRRVRCAVHQGWHKGGLAAEESPNSWTKAFLFGAGELFTANAPFNPTWSTMNMALALLLAICCSPDSLIPERILKWAQSCLKEDTSSTPSGFLFPPLLPSLSIILKHHPKSLCALSNRAKVIHSTQC